MGQIIKPNFEAASGPTPDAETAMANNVNALLKWATMVDQRDMAFRVQFETVLHQIIASLEGISRAIVEKGEIVTKDELDELRKDYLNQVAEAKAAREEEAKRVSSQIWTPDKKIVPVR